jgi:hypothetical protein
MEPEGSLPCSQKLATCPYPEPNEFNPHPQTLFPQDPSQCYPLIYAEVFLVVPSLRVRKDILYPNMNCVIVLYLSNIKIRNKS